LKTKLKTNQMKRIVIFLAVILFTATTATSFAQKSRTLSKGFSINFISGIPVSPYGYAIGGDVSSDYGKLFGLQIGSRWYFSPGEKFGAGLMVNWFDITASYKSFQNSSEAVVCADVSLFEVGPVATFALTNDIALDGYYNLRPTGYAVGYTYDEGANLEMYAGSGISHAFGTAFRWKVLNVGLEYNFGAIKISNTDSESYDAENKYKFNINNFRIMLGVKF
jgi:hypothetical protein